METAVYVFDSILPVGFCGALAFDENVSSCKTVQTLSLQHEICWYHQRKDDTYNTTVKI